MKNLLRLASLSLAWGASVHAGPFLAIGSGAELFLTGSAGIRADDNIFLGPKAESDLIFDLTPGVEVSYGKNAQLKSKLTLQDHFSRYSDNSRLNTNLFSGAFATSFDDGKTKLRFNASFRELNQNTFDVRPTLVGGTAGGLVRRDLFETSADTEIELSQLTSVAAGVAFGRDHYKRAGFTDADYLTVPLDAFYKWTAKTDISVGYRYRDVRLALGRDSTEHFLNIGARGEFSPKLKGRLAVGLNRRSVERAGSDNQLGLEADFNYELTPKTTLELGARNDFGISPQGQQLKNKSLRAQVIARIAAEWSVGAGLFWRAIDYGVRTDDYYEFQLNAAYVVSPQVRIIGGYVHRDYNSSRLSEFKNNVFSVSADFRY
ncbi:MAG: outer membrane beta-barrel protein [Opitutaceae bacterium]|nr:outer membrane beta-barrel protein [Opitutaceae bacterium]